MRSAIEGRVEPSPLKIYSLPSRAPRGRPAPHLRTGNAKRFRGEGRPKVRALFLEACFRRARFKNALKTRLRRYRAVKGGILLRTLVRGARFEFARSSGRPSLLSPPRVAEKLCFSRRGAKCTRFRTPSAGVLKNHFSGRRAASDDAARAVYQRLQVRH